MATKEKSDFVNEGHTENSTAPRLSKGQFQRVGTTVELTQAPTAVNQKTGHTGNGEE